MFTLEYPWAYVLLPLPLLLRYLLPAYRESRSAVRVPFLGVLTRLTGQTPSSGSAVLRRTKLQWMALIVVWLGTVAALSGPQWLEEPLVEELPMRDMVVAVDLSGSMDTRDFTDNAGAVTDRLTAAKQVLDEFFARRQGDRISLILFGSAAFVQVPFTGDLDVVRQLLDEAQVRMLGPRTVLGDAMGLSINLFDRSEVEERVLIVLTDGNDTGSQVPPDRAAEIARDKGVTVHTVAMGDPQASGESALDEDTLRQVAETTGGGYFHASDRAELEAIYRRLDELNPKQVETLSYRPVRELFQWPLAASLCLGMLLLIIGELGGRRDSLVRTRADPMSS